jgi:hypothetical protein
LFLSHQGVLFAAVSRLFQFEVNYLHDKRYLWGEQRSGVTVSIGGTATNAQWITPAGAFLPGCAPLTIFIDIFKQKNDNNIQHMKRA